MSNPKFVLNQDWTYETEFLGTKNIKTLYNKGEVFNTNEKEYFDVQGQYYINLLETNPDKKNFGDSIASIGVGSYLTHARNNLQATILNVYHNGAHQWTDKQRLLWGINYQKDVFNDVLSEWKNKNLLGVDIKGCIASIIKKMSAQSGELEFRFKYFIDKKSPVTRISSPMSYDCSFEGILSNPGKEDEEYKFILGIKVN